jgi:hypothetical protein
LDTYKKEEIMIKARAWPVRAMYILIAAALAIGLLITAAPAQKVSAAVEVSSEWDRVSTPTADGWVLATDSVISDYALDATGEVAYAIVHAYGLPEEMMGGYSLVEGGYYLLKSDDHAATWDDITDAVEDVDDSYNITSLLQVATDWEDPDFVAVALWEDGELRVYFSTDGGVNFEDAGEVEDGGVYLDIVSDLAISYEAAGKREMAIGGDDGTDSAIFRSTVTGDSASSWEDATAYAGWDDDGDFNSTLVTDIIFSPSWGIDKTILVTTVAPGAISDETVYLQCGSWGTSAGWNEWSTLGIEAVPIKENVDIPMWLATMDARGIAGMTLPENYNSKNTDERVLWVWVNYYDVGTPMCALMRVDDDSADPVGPMGQIEDGEVWLTNVAYQGTIAEGKAIAGVLGNGVGGYAECCDGVQVYRNAGITNMDICCIRWEDACKPPTGRAGMAVSYVGEDKAYAVALGEAYGTIFIDEGAWSVTFDDGDTWNQLSLIDTYIDYFSDTAVSPDCNKIMLVSVNEKEDFECHCDSVWLHADDLPEAEEYSGKWIRTWCGTLEGYDSVYDPEHPEHGLLRLALDETTGDNVFLVDRMSGNVYWNDLEGLACWDPIPSTEVDDIVDLEALDTDTLFALDESGNVAMFDDDEWQEAVNSEVDDGWTIAVWGDNATHVLVGGQDGDVSYSEDGGETFDVLEDIPTIDGHVTVAFDTYFDTNDVVYAATDEGDHTGGIYQWTIGESEKWMDLKAEPLESQLGLNILLGPTSEDDTVEVAYTGLVVDRPGNPFTSADNGGVIYASYVGNWSGTNFTGVARSLEREVTICLTCLTWDFLYEGLTFNVEGFNAWPDALKICGCLTPDTNSHLFAIDWWDYYDMVEYETGALWTFEDCYAKKAPDITFPDDGEVIPADPCSCYSVPFTVTWDPLCDACSYDIAFALDEEFDMPVSVNQMEDMTYHLEEQDVPTFSVLGGPDGGLSCETTYYVRVRAADAATGQIIHSWWSDPISITIAPSVEAGIIDLVAPAPGATDVPTKNVGFSWDLLATADAFDWVLSKNADLSSPIDSKTGVTSTATTYTGTLEHGTTYYWKVTAYNEGAVISTSAVGTFTTSPTGAFCCPQCGLCFDTQAELQAHVDAEHAVPATPFWVWIVIAIGAVLVIVVIVLIFRTRRV